MQKILIRLLAVFLLFTLAAAQAPSQTPTQKDKGKQAPPPPVMKERMKFPDQTSRMSEEAGCNIANKGKKGQVCLYDIESIAAFAKKKERPPVYVSPHNEESILWYSSAQRQFRIAELVAYTKDCPANPFAQDVTGDARNDKYKDEMLQTAIFSGPARKDALGCEYKPVLKVKVKGRMQTWDPHIIIGP
ncbi:MAG TPA: hypothetical protein VLT85_13635 [Terriglobales bacterium]|nr:hypothetical protein [Terriglobales bacterium]